MVSQHIGFLGKEIKALVKTCLEIAWFSRGGWNYDQVLQMSAGERDLAIEIINERLEAAGKMMYPVF
ncbi:MAG: hypothetical protein QXN55_01260 [Candidatus Nitrosotenuis sp.]